MKTLKFAQNMVPLIESREKTAIFRLYDDKNLQIGDVVKFFVKETGHQFGIAIVTEVLVKLIGKLAESDWVGHERYEKDEVMYTEFRKYYGDNVGPETEVKIIRFQFEPKLYKSA